MTLHALNFSDNVEPLLLDVEQSILALEQHPGYEDLICTTARCWQTIRGVANLFNHDNITRLTAQIAGCFDAVCRQQGVVDQELVKAAITLVDLIRHSGNDDLDGKPTHNMAAAIATFSTTTTSSLAPERSASDTKILIVDDEDVNRTLLEEFVRSFNKNIQVTSVDSASEAIFYYLTERFDLVFLDIMMPEVDGNHFISIVEKNRQANNLATAPNIVVQTAVQSMEELLTLVQKDSVLEVIRKPILRERICTCIERYCTAFQAKSLAA